MNLINFCESLFKILDFKMIINLKQLLYLLLLICVFIEKCNVYLNKIRVVERF